MTAVVDVLAPCGIPFGLKWPNDLVAYRQSDEKEPEPSGINTQRGQIQHLVKIGGVIGEQKKDRVILGLGLNVFSAPEMPERAIPPSSLCALGAKNIPGLLDLAQRILSVWENLETYQAQRQIAFRWPDPGDEIRWGEGSGVCQGWATDGRLAVLTKSGLVHLASGDVSGVIAGAC
jgi:biotin-(acetyl-CoA carboxylase) ligase